MGGSSKSPPPPPPAAPPPPPSAQERAVEYTSARRETDDARLHRRGRAANVLAGAATTGSTQTGTKTLLGQ